MSTITHKRLVNAFIKAGMVVSNYPNSTRRWIATNPKTHKCVEWSTQDGFVPAKDGKEAHWDANCQITTHVTWRSPQTDAMSDCFCDSYYSTIRSAVAAIS